MFIPISRDIFCQTKDELKRLAQKSEIIAIQQIPPDVLKKMTTEEVFQAWLDLPGRM